MYLFIKTNKFGHDFPIKSKIKMEFKIIDKNTGEDKIFSNDAIADFLEVHLGRFGDKKDDILKCLKFVFNKGGFIAVAVDNNELLGATVFNETGMDSYIPENILVYITVHEHQRGKGLGSKLMQKAIDQAKGSIALHVEADNPAKKLYERLGFTNKYLEMRLQR
jgi:GNAT superfamily N-acetyltransferase